MSRRQALLALCAGLGLAACSSDPAAPQPDGPALGDRGPASEVSTRELGLTDGPRADSTGKLDGAPPPPSATCTPPITLADTTGSQVVGTGTPASCTRDALAAAVAKGGAITFNCGSAPATIAVTSTLVAPATLDTVIDGEGKITLDGGGKVRILELVHGDYRVNTKKLVLQRLTFQNGSAPGSDYVAPSTTNPKCAYGYKTGSGGAVHVRDAVLHVLDCVFKNNAAATPGPDVGGGAIYVLASLEAKIVGCTFSGNHASNGGAVGMLQSTGTFVNTTFQGNQASGTGGNHAGETGCPGVGHAGQGGAGGNGGAVYIDGSDDLEQYFCGVTFAENSCNDFGGCLFRTANNQQRKATFLKSRFEGNQAGTGAGCLYISNSELTISQCLVANNTVLAGLGGGVRTELGTVATITNTTFYGNSSDKGLAGALSHAGTGEIRNCTFAKNRAEGGPGYFSAALGMASAVAIHNTIFLDNTTKDPWNPQACSFKTMSGAGNFQWPKQRSDGKTDDTACVSGVTWADAQLGPLTSNGGPTLSMLPQSGSPVIGAGASCPAEDQRGQPRSTTQCAAGAVEP